jgi:hypothetical protein
LPDVRFNAVDPGYTATDLNGHVDIPDCRFPRDVAVQHGTADLGIYRDAPNKPICGLHADVAKNLAGTPNGGSARNYQEVSAPSAIPATAG